MWMVVGLASKAAVGRCAEMAEEGVGTGGQERRRPAAALGERLGADRIDTADGSRSSRWARSR